MPTYTFKDIETGERQEQVMKISEVEDFMAANPNLKQVICSPPALGYNMKMGMKPPDSFREKLKNIGKFYKGSNINTF